MLGGFIMSMFSLQNQFSSCCCDKMQQFLIFLIKLMLLSPGTPHCLRNTGRKSASCNCQHVQLKWNMRLQCSSEQCWFKAGQIQCVFWPFPQVHAQHHRRAVRVCGGLPVWPGGDAAGSQGEPTALPRGLRPQRLGPLEPLQPGESWTHTRKQRLSCLPQSRYGNIKLVWSPLRFILISLSCQKYFLWGSRNSKCGSTVLLRAACGSLSTGWSPSTKEEYKRYMNWETGEKWLIYQLYYTALTAHSAGKEDDLW